MSRPRRINKHLPKYVTVIHGSYWYRPPKAKPVRVAAVGEEQALYKFMAERAAPTGPVTTLNDVFDRYVRDVLPGLAPRTQKDYLDHIKKLRIEYGHREPNDLKPRDIGSYLDVAYGKISRNRSIGVLSAIYTKAVGRWYVADRNPCIGVERNPSKPRERYITDEEYEAVYNVMPIRMKIAMELALLTGQRQGDILKLKWADIADDGITFRQSKTGQGRHVLFTDRLHAVINQARLLIPQLPREYVIRTEKGRRYTSEGFRAIWQRYMSKALRTGALKERFTFHDIRAKTVSDESDVDTAQLRAGHTNKAMTLRVYSRKVRNVRALK